MHKLIWAMRDDDTQSLNWYEGSAITSDNSREASFWSSRRREARFSLRCRAKGTHRRMEISVRVFISIYLYIWMGARNLTRLRTKTMARARASRLIFSPLQWLTRDFKHGTFRDQWIPLNSVSEVSMREQGERRLQARKESRRPPLAEDWVDSHSGL